MLDDLLMLGIQGSRQSAGGQSLSQRTDRIGSTSLPDAIRPDGPLVSMWSVRGAPHAHRASQLDLVRGALAPLETDDGGTDYVEAVEEVAAALTKVVAGATPKGEASAEVAGVVSKRLVRWCERCEAEHVPDGMFRAAGRQAQVVIGPEDRRATMLYPRPRVRQDKVAKPRLALVQAYLRVNGPTRMTLFRDWMEAGTPGTNDVWDELRHDLVRVEVDNHRYELPEALLDAVQEAPTAKGVALLPPNDPYLRQVDRTLLVPDRQRRQQVYRALSGPGALLVDGEIAGIWRYRRSDREVTIEPYETLDSAREKAAEMSAAVLAASTGDAAPSIRWS
ncbi:MAG: winged helix DNA-binding domain-containing protein [Micrococcales bacterium]|nr:winged helix DNA-binding domain-containing protein [Micrococcales bacterium]